MRQNTLLVIFLVAILSGCSTISQRIASSDPAISSKALKDYNTSSPVSQAKAVKRFAQELSDSNADVRTNAIKTLSIIGPKAVSAIPELAKALHDPTPSVRQAAIEVLLKINQEIAITEFAKALSDSNVDVRNSAINALNEMGSAAKTAAPELAKALSDTDENVRDYALSILKKIGPDTSGSIVPALIKAFSDSNPDMRESVAEALIQISTEVAITEFTKALRDSNPSVRKSAVKALYTIGPEAIAAATELAKALWESDTDVREAATEALIKISTEAAIPELIKALNDSNTHVHNNAVYALGKIGPDAKVVIPKLTIALRDSNSYTRKLAIEALLNINLEVAVAELAKALSDSNADVRKSAAEALYAIGPEAKIAVPELSKALREPNTDVREAATEALIKISTETAIPELVKALSDSKSYIRNNAINALGKIGPDARSAIPKLITILMEPEYSTLIDILNIPDMCKVTLKALVKIGPETIPPLAEALLTASGKGRILVAETLIELGANGIIPLIEYKNEKYMKEKSAREGRRYIKDHPELQYNAILKKALRILSETYSHNVLTAVMNNSTSNPIAGYFKPSWGTSGFAEGETRGRVVWGVRIKDGEFAEWARWDVDTATGEIFPGDLPKFWISQGWINPLPEDKRYVNIEAF